MRPWPSCRGCVSRRPAARLTCRLVVGLQADVWSTGIVLLEMFVAPLKNVSRDKAAFKKVRAPALHRRAGGRAGGPS